MVLLWTTRDGDKIEPAPTAQVQQETQAHATIKPSSDTASTNGESSSKSGKAYCQKCKKKCSGEVLRVQDNYYHIDCFKCKECRNSLASGGFFTKDGEYYCSKDYQDRFGTKCGRCGDYVEGEVVTALGSTYHQTCFRCARCRQPFPAGERVTYTGKEYLCQKCVHIPVVESKTPEQSPGSCRPECAGCQEELKEGQALIALDKQWHIWCFKCHTCNAMLHGEYMGKDGKPYCEKDYQSQFGVKCAYCSRFISGKVLQAGDNHHFHPTCARCTKCGDPFGDGEEMYLQGAAIWHPRCGPGPSENGTIISTGIPNGSIHVNHAGESKEDGLSSTASETQLFRSRTPSLNGSFRSTDTGHSFNRKYVSMRTSSPGLILREYPREHPPHDDITRIYTYSYLVTEPSMGYLKRPIHPYDKPPRSPQFHRPPPDSVGSTRKHSWGKERAKTAMKALVDSIQTESPRPRSPHMNNEEPIEMAHYPDGARPNPKQPPRIERDDFPAPPFPYTDPERRRRWSGSYKSIPESEEDDTENVEDVPDSARSDDPKLKREEEELTKIASGIGKVFLQQVKEREKIKHWKATHLDPRKASRVPSAAHESVHKLRYDSPINASPSRDLTHQRPWDDGDTDFDRGSSLRSSTGRSIPTVTSYNVVSSLRCAPKPGYGLRASTLPAAGRSGGEISWDGEYSFTGLGREKSQSGEFSSGKSDVSAGSLTDTERGRVSAELRSSTTYSSGLTQTGGFSAHLRQSLPNMVSSSDPPKIYPVHLLMTSNYRLPADVDRMHLERHISDGDFASIFQIPRVDFYRLPEWKRNDLKRRARLF